MSAYVQSNAQPKTVLFADVAPKTAFYPGVNGTSRYGKCVRLFRQIFVKHADPALPFAATAISENGILIPVKEDEPVSFSSPPVPFKAGFETAEASEASLSAPGVAVNRMEIPITDGCHFAEGLQKGRLIRAYVRTTGQLV